MRPIDSDALEARMYHDAFEVDSDMQRWDSGCWIRYKMFENAIREAPTIEEHKKGEWLELTNTNHTYVCSVCGRMLVNITDGKNMVTKNYPFCHCGADMRGEQEESDRTREPGRLLDAHVILPDIRRS